MRASRTRILDDVAGICRWHPPSMLSAGSITQTAVTQVLHHPDRARRRLTFVCVASAAFIHSTDKTLSSTLPSVRPEDPILRTCNRLLRCWMGACFCQPCLTIA